MAGAERKIALTDFDVCRDLFENNGLELSKTLHEKLEIYSGFLREYNQKVNLTAITEPYEIMTKHFLDSILLSRYCEIPEGARLIDVGTGAGFPSVPLKLYRPDLKITLLDSLNKRIVFLRELCQRLDIECEAVHGRAEELGRDEDYRERFDIVTARAVAAMPVLCEYCMPFVKKGGKFAAMKGPNESFKAAGNAVKVLGGECENEINYTLSGNDERKLFIVKKISHVAAKYPRNSGQIKNKPL